MLISLWPHLLILSGVTSPLFSSSVLGTYRPGDFIFQSHIFLPFHTVHGVLKERILKWFAIPFSNGPHFVRTLHHDPSVLGSPTWASCLSYCKYVSMIFFFFEIVIMFCFSAMYPEELLYHMVVQFLIFWVISVMFYIYIFLFEGVNSSFTFQMIIEPYLTKLVCGLN